MASVPARKKISYPTSGWRPAWLWAVGLWLVFLAYALVRYVVIQGVALTRLPLFLNNKAIALASVGLIMLSFIVGPIAHAGPRQWLQWLPLRKYFGLAGFALAALHSLISVLLLSPAAYPRFFLTNGTLTFQGELSMLSGVLALFIFTIMAIIAIPSVEERLSPASHIQILRYGYLAVLLTIAHIGVMGYASWLTPAKWHWVPPMTFIAFVMLLAIVLAKMFSLLVRPKTSR